MTNKDITKIYFQGNEIVALYQGSTLIFKKSGGHHSDATISGVWDSTDPLVIRWNGFDNQITIPVNDDKTFEYTNSETLNNAISMFADNLNLTSLDLSNLDTSNVTNMCDMFWDCQNLQSLDLSNFDTSKVTKMNRMFSGCQNLQSLDLSNFDTSNVTNMGYMLSDCQNLQSLDLSNFDTSKVTDMGYMFAKGYKMSDLYVNFIINEANNLYETFFYETALKNVVGKFEGAKYYLDLSYCPLTAQSAMVFINGLATVTEKLTLALSATTYDSLTKEQIAIATSKGWTVTRN